MTTPAADGLCPVCGGYMEHDVCARWVSDCFKLGYERQRTLAEKLEKALRGLSAELRTAARRNEGQANHEYFNQSNERAAYFAGLREARDDAADRVDAALTLAGRRPS